TVTDQFGASNDSSLTITVTGTNDTPVAQAKTDADRESTRMNASDLATEAADGAVISYSAASGQGAVAGLSFNSDGSYSFDAANAAYHHLPHAFPTRRSSDLTVTDQFGASNDSSLTITVTGTNDTPVAQAKTD